MANPPPVNSAPVFNNKVRDFSFSDKGHGRSKTQMCLKKIIDFMVSSRSLSVEESNQGKGLLGEKGREKKRGLGIDLNLRLGFGLESENFNKGFSSACSGVGDGDEKGCGVISVIDCNSSVDKSSSEGECDPKGVEEEEEEQEVIEEEEEEERKEISEITNLPDMETEEGLDEKEEQSEIKAVEEEEEEAEVLEVEVDDERGKERCDEEEKISLRNCKKNGYLDLLVEAARLISGNFDDETDEEEEEGKRRRLSPIIEAERGPKGCRSKRNQTWMFDFYEEFEDISPVVRSKRGRNQVLPYRFRDSVLDPWKRFSKQRSSRVSTKSKN